MKKIISIGALLCTFTVFAQKGNLILFSEEGANFTLVINGVKQNEAPQANVKIEGLNAVGYKASVVFEDIMMGSLDKTLYVTADTETTYAIKRKDKDNSLVIRVLSQIPISEVKAPAEPVAIASQPQQQTVSTANMTQTTTTTTTTSAGGNGESLSINININDGTNGGTIGMGVGVNTNTNVQTTQTTTSSTGGSVSQNASLTATLSGDVIRLSDGRTFTLSYQKLMFPYPEFEMLDPSGAKIKISYDGNYKYSSEVPFLWKNAEIDKYLKLEVEDAYGRWSIKLIPKTGFKTTISSGASTTTVVETVTTSSSSSNSGCNSPMGNAAFSDGKTAIESKTFADTQMTVAKQITKSNCPTSEQIRDFTKIFSFESGKLEYAKFAYDYCFDKGNYYKVNDAFGFESSISELNSYIEGK